MASASRKNVVAIAWAIFAKQRRKVRSRGEKGWRRRKREKRKEKREESGAIGDVRGRERDLGGEGGWGGGERERGKRRVRKGDRSWPAWSVWPRGNALVASCTDCHERTWRSRRRSHTVAHATRTCLLLLAYPRLLAMGPTRSDAPRASIQPQIVARESGEHATLENDSSRNFELNLCCHFYSPLNHYPPRVIRGWLDYRDYGIGSRYCFVLRFTRFAGDVFLFGIVWLRITRYRFFELVWSDWICTF